jgi:hypothetical protein
MKNLENYGVQEMNAKEIQEIDGGSWWRVLGPIATAAWVIDEVLDFVDEMNKPLYV